MLIQAGAETQWAAVSVALRGGRWGKLGHGGRSWSGCARKNASRFSRPASSSSVSRRSPGSDHSFVLKNRHAGHRKAGCVRLVGKKTVEREGWNVSFDHIARHFRRVAGCEIVRNAKPRLHHIEVFGFQNLGRKSGFLQMLHPAQTAAAIRVPMNRHDRLRRG